MKKFGVEVNDEITQEREEVGNNYHISNKSICGTPSEYYEHVLGSKKKVCVECWEIKRKKKKKSCLKCDQKFTPGCKVKFICVSCTQHNVRSDARMYHSKK